MTEIHKNYCSGDSKCANLLTIYIEEAHAIDEWHLPEAPDIKSGNALISVHQNIEERINAAKKFVKCKNFTMDIAVDSMGTGNAVDRYGAWPERLYIILDGIIVYKGGFGPFDYRLDEVQDWLIQRFGKRE